MRRTVVITGLGFITPIGQSRAEVGASLRALRHGLGPVDWLPGAGVKIGALIPGFDLRSDHTNLWRWPAGWTIPRETLRGLAPSGVYALGACEQALAESGLDRAALADGETGLYCASSGSARLFGRLLGDIVKSDGHRVPPFGVVRAIAGTLNFNLAAHYGIRGPVAGFSSACTSGGHALGFAHDEIALGRQRRMLVVAGEDLAAETIIPFAGLGALSRQSEPERASRPFDTERDGFVGAGGAVALVLEEAGAAAARGARCIAELAGWGQSGDGCSPVKTDPAGAGLERAMRLALADAGCATGDIDYVNAHATSTPAGDLSEGRALLRVFGAGGPPVSSTKALTGHPLSLAAAMEAAFCALALDEGFVPGQAHLRNVEPELAGLNLPRTTVAAPIRAVVSNSSAFGGSNVVLVLRR